MSVILLVTHSEDTHADLVEEHIAASKCSYFRLNTDDLTHGTRLFAECSSEKWRGIIECDGNQCRFEDVAVVWWRRPVEPRSLPITDLGARTWAAEEAFHGLTGLLHQLDAQFVSHPNSIRWASNKPIQLKEASRLGFKIPSTIVTHTPNELIDFASTHEKQGIVYKTLSSMRIESNDGEKLIFTNTVSGNHLSHSESVRSTLHLFQERVPKKVEIRATAVGDKVYACEIHSQNTLRTKDDWRHYNIPETPHYPHQLPKNIEDLCILFLRRFNLRFGAFDLVLTPKDEYVFLEINPNGQWQWIEMLTGLPISKSIAELLIDLSKEARPSDEKLTE